MPMIMKNIANVSMCIFYKHSGTLVSVNTCLADCDLSGNYVLPNDDWVLIAVIYDKCG